MYVRSCMSSCFYLTSPPPISQCTRLVTETLQYQKDPYDFTFVPEVRNITYLSHTQFNLYKRVIRHCNKYFLPVHCCRYPRYCYEPRYQGTMMIFISLPRKPRTKTWWTCRHDSQNKLLHLLYVPSLSPYHWFLFLSFYSIIITVILYNYNDFLLE